MAIRVYHRDDATTRLPMIARDARLVVWPGVGAISANMNYVLMQSEEANVPHRHPVSEDTIVILAGEGTIEDHTNGVSHRFGAGQVVHVPAGLVHQVKADRGVAIESVGGPCPADLEGLRAAGVLGVSDPAPDPAGVLGAVVPGPDAPEEPRDDA